MYRADLEKKLFKINRLMQNTVTCLFSVILIFNNAIKIKEMFQNVQIL